MTFLVNFLLREAIVNHINQYERKIS